MADNNTDKDVRSKSQPEKVMQAKKQTLLTSWFKTGDGNAATTTPAKHTPPVSPLEGNEENRGSNPANSTTTNTTSNATHAQIPIQATKRPSPNVVSTTKKRTPSAACGNERIKTRRQWVRGSKCFLCEQRCEKEDLEACQCFEKNGVNGLGIIGCINCDGDGISSCSGGNCNVVLCLRSCEFISRVECSESCCKKCIDTFMDTKCENCQKAVCKDCASRSCYDCKPCVTSKCRVCKRAGCKNCGDEHTLTPCDVCEKAICIACVDPRCANTLIDDESDGESDDERLCRRCADGVADDYRREDNAIRKYGANYEDYDW